MPIHYEKDGPVASFVIDNGKVNVLTPAMHRELFEALREWRRALAREADVAAFVIFNDATLREIAARRPRSRSQLLDVAGVGPVKAQRFGDDVLGIVRDLS